MTRRFPISRHCWRARWETSDQAIEILQGLVKQSERPEGQYTVPEANNRGLFLERLGLVYRDQEKFSQAMDTFKQIQALGPTQGPLGGDADHGDSAPRAPAG